MIAIRDAFSPLMYIQYEDGNYLNDQFRSILREPALSADKVMARCKDMYFLLRLTPFAADELAELFIGTGSYHRNYHW